MSYFRVARTSRSRGPLSVVRGGGGLGRVHARCSNRAVLQSMGSPARSRRRGRPRLHPRPGFHAVHPRSRNLKQGCRPRGGPATSTEILSTIRDCSVRRKPLPRRRPILTDVRAGGRQRGQQGVSRRSFPGARAISAENRHQRLVSSCAAASSPSIVACVLLGLVIADLFSKLNPMYCNCDV
jgi:hypothetical protein